MYVIGLTGGIASGKSTVSGILSQLGAFILDADQIAHAVMEPGCPAWEDIVNTFGKAVLLADRTIDRRELGNIVFHDKSARNRLEEIMHPRIKQCIEDKIKEYARRDGKILVLDIPLLYEVGWQQLASEVWVVYVDSDTQLQRLMHRSGLSPDEAAVRIAAQMDLAAKARLADVVIDNNGDLQHTRGQVFDAWEKAMGLAALQ